MIGDIVDNFLQVYAWFWTNSTYLKLFWDCIHWDLFQEKGLEGTYRKIIYQKYFH
jgi:hypothetical protein